MRILFLAAFLLLGACAKTDSANIGNQEAIYTTYDAQYIENQNESKLEFTASFNLGGPTGTYLVLSGDSSVSVDNDRMVAEVNALNQVVYRYVIRNPSQREFEKTYTIKYLNNNQVLFENQVSFALPVTLSVENGRAENSVKDPLVVRWQSVDRINRESLTSSISNLDTRASTINPITQEAIGTTGTFTFAPANLQEVKAGRVLISSCRHRYLENARLPYTGGSIRVGSCSSMLEHRLTDQ